eukprot:1525074-Heterocapsa_arctica.AAC.1
MSRHARPPRLPAAASTAGQSPLVTAPGLAQPQPHPWPRHLRPPTGPSSPAARTPPRGLLL